MRTYFVIKHKDGYVSGATKVGIVVSASITEAKKYKSIGNAHRFGKRYRAEEIVEVADGSARKIVNVIKLHR